MDTGAIERLTAAKGALNEKEGVFKVSVPRKDLSVIIAGMKMSPVATENLVRGDGLR